MSELSLRARRARSAWWLIAPMIAALALAAGWPLARTIWLSFTDATLAAPMDVAWIGFANYLEHDGGQWYGVLADPQWWLAVRNTLVFAVASVSLETVLGLAIALALHAPFPGRGLVRAAVLVPWAIPTVVSAKLWAWMLNDEFGILNHVLLGLGVIATPVAWVADPDLALAAVIAVDVWKTTPFMVLLILAGLQMLPPDCYEAARVDGVHPVKVFFRVTLPLLWPALAVAIAFRALDALRVFDLVYVLTANSTSTMSISVYARQQLIDFQDIGYGSAASTLVFLTVGLAAIAYLRLARLRPGGDRVTGRRFLKRAAFAAFLAAILMFALFPLYYALVTSVTPPGDLFRPAIIPDRWTAEHYGAILRGPFPRSIVNSALVSAAVVALTLGIALGAAYALARIRFHGRAAVLFGVLAISMFPQIAVLAGMFELVRSFGLFDSLWALIFSYLTLTLPFAAWMLATFMRSIPVELEEAAALDGASPLTTLLRVFVPLLQPALAATSLLVFIAAWNEFLFALTFTLSDESRTVPVAIALLSGASAFELPWGPIMAAAVLVTVPIVALALVFQRHVVSGLLAGAIKQ